MLIALFWIAFGGLTGWVVCILRGEMSNKRISLIVLMGMLGGLVGGYSGNHLGMLGDGYDASTTSLMSAVIGAVVVVGITARNNDLHSR